MKIIRPGLEVAGGQSLQEVLLVVLQWMRGSAVPENL
jgi:hypothetical protein